MIPNPVHWRGKLVCVTGGTGFLGYHLVKLLVSLGAHVRILALEPRQRPAWIDRYQVETRFGDIRDQSLTRSAVSDCDVVLHTAGTVAVWGPALAEMHAVHCAGTQNVLDAAARTAMVVHTSSVVAVGASLDGGHLKESDAFNLDHLKVDYVHAKRRAERLALDAAATGRNVVVVNPGYLVGPEDAERSVMGRFCRRFWKGRVPIAPPGGMNLVDVRDVAAGHLLAAEHGRPGERYILGGDNLRWHSIVSLLARVGGLRPRFLPSMPHWFMAMLAAGAELRAAYRKHEPYPSLQQYRLGKYFWFYDSSRARSALNYSPRPIEQSLADAYQWFTQAESFRLRTVQRFWLRPAG